MPAGVRLTYCPRPARVEAARRPRLRFVPECRALTCVVNTRGFTEHGTVASIGGGHVHISCRREAHPSHSSFSRGDISVSHHRPHGCSFFQVPTEAIDVHKPGLDFAGKKDFVESMHGPNWKDLTVKDKEEGTCTDKMIFAAFMACVLQYESDRAVIDPDEEKTVRDKARQVAHIQNLDGSIGHKSAKQKKTFKTGARVWIGNLWPEDIFFRWNKGKTPPVPLQDVEVSEGNFLRGYLLDHSYPMRPGVAEVYRDISNTAHLSKTHCTTKSETYAKQTEDSFARLSKQQGPASHHDLAPTHVGGGGVRSAPRPEPKPHQCRPSLVAAPPVQVVEPESGDDSDSDSCDFSKPVVRAAKDVPALPPPPPKQHKVKHNSGNTGPENSEKEGEPPVPDAGASLWGPMGPPKERKNQVTKVNFALAQITEFQKHMTTVKGPSCLSYTATQNTKLAGKFTTALADDTQRLYCLPKLPGQIFDGPDMIHRLTTHQSANVSLAPLGAALVAKSGPAASAATLTAAIEQAENGCRDFNFTAHFVLRKLEFDKYWNEFKAANDLDNLWRIINSSALDTGSSVSTLVSEAPHDELESIQQHQSALMESWHQDLLREAKDTPMYMVFAEGFKTVVMLDESLQAEVLLLKTMLFESDELEHKEYSELKLRAKNLQKSSRLVRPLFIFPVGKQITQGWDDHESLLLRDNDGNPLLSSLVEKHRKLIGLTINVSFNQNGVLVVAPDTLLRSMRAITDDYTFFKANTSNSFRKRRAAEQSPMLDFHATVLRNVIAAHRESYSVGMTAVLADFLNDKVTGAWLGLQEMLQELVKFDFVDHSNNYIIEANVNGELDAYHNAMSVQRRLVGIISIVATELKPDTVEDAHLKDIALFVADSDPELLSTTRMDQDAQPNESEIATAVDTWKASLIHNAFAPYATQAVFETSAMVETVAALRKHLVRKFFEGLLSRTMSAIEKVASAKLPVAAIQAYIGFAAGDPVELPDVPQCAPGDADDLKAVLTELESLIGRMRTVKDSFADYIGPSAFRGIDITGLSSRSLDYTAKAKGGPLRRISPGPGPSLIITFTSGATPGISTLGFRSLVSEGTSSF